MGFTTDTKWSDGSQRPGDSPAVTKENLDQDDGKVTSKLMGILRYHSPLSPGKKNTCAANINKPSFKCRMSQGVVFPPVVMAAVWKLEMGLNPWPVSSFAFSGLSGTAPDENGARVPPYEWLFVWWSDTITKWVTQLTGSQSDAQFDFCVFHTLQL